MKNIIAVFSLLIVVGCNDTKEKEINDLIVQNNKYYQSKLEQYQMELKREAEDRPATVDEEYHKTIFDLTDTIRELKNIKSYDSIFETIKRLGYENRIREGFKPMHSENKEMLKNNLYVNLMHVIEAYKLQHIVYGIGCRLSSRFKIRKSIENDSVKLDFYTGNPFQLNVDYLIDGGDTIRYGGYESDQTYKVWSIRYKPKSKNSSCHGKIFYMDDFYNNLILVEEFDDRNALSQNPF